MTKLQSLKYSFPPQAIAADHFNLPMVQQKIPRDAKNGTYLQDVLIFFVVSVACCCFFCFFVFIHVKHLDSLVGVLNVAIFRG